MCAPKGGHGSVASAARHGKRGGGVRLVAAPRARRERSPARRGNKVTTWAITGWRRGTREARGRARTRRCLSPWRSRRGLGRGKRARGVSRLSVEPRGPCAVVYRCRPRGPEPRLGSACASGRQREFLREARRPIGGESFESMGPSFREFFFWLFNNDHYTARAESRGELKRNALRNVGTLSRCSLAEHLLERVRADAQVGGDVQSAHRGLDVL